MQEKLEKKVVNFVMFHEMQNSKCLHLGKIKHLVKCLAFCLMRNFKNCHYKLQLSRVKDQGDLAFSFSFLFCCFFMLFICCLFCSQTTRTIRCIIAKMGMKMNPFPWTLLFLLHPKIRVIYYRALTTKLLKAN